MKIYLGLTLLVAALAIISIVVGYRFKRKMSPSAFALITIISAVILMISIVFALCLGFFMR